MKKYLAVIFIISLVACKKESSSGDSAGSDVQRMSCTINGISFQNDAGIQNLSLSYQSGSIPAYSIIGRNGDRQVRLYIQTAKDSTGTFETPGLAKVIYSDSLGDYYPAHDSGMVTITRNDAQAFAGKFYAVHTFQDYTRIFSNGEFYIKK